MWGEGENRWWLEFAGLDSGFVHGFVCKRFHALIWSMTCMCMIYLMYHNDDVLYDDVWLSYDLHVENVHSCISPIACVSSAQTSFHNHSFCYQLPNQHMLNWVVSIMKYSSCINAHNWVQWQECVRMWFPLFW